MSNRIRIPLYIVLALLAGVSGYFAFSNFGRMMDRAGDRHGDIDQIEPERPPSLEALSPASGLNTNNAAAVPGATNAAAVTNVSATVTNPVSDGTAGTATETNTTGPRPEVDESPDIPKALDLSSSASGSSSAKPGGGRIGLWMGLFVVSLICLGLLAANDISHFVGNRALKTIYNDEGEGLKNPEYEEAEQVWSNGQYLEAIGLMREYLKKNPREQHVAIRIAEIYEKDLGNYLAAALEYEEVLKHKLPPDRWGWAAIHLCNLYFKLNQEQKGYDLLRRLVKEHPNVPAAEKARKRLGQVEGVSSEQIATEQHVRSSTRATTAQPPEETEPPGPPSNLPPGFRPKK